MASTSITKPASTVTFGIEIECALPRELVESPDSPFYPGGYHRGLQIIGAPDGWNAQHDGSISAPSGYMGVEVVSPVLKGIEGLEEVVYMLDLLKSLRAKVNKSCGLHVHVEGKTLSSDQQDRFIDLFKAFEMAFFALNGRAVLRRLTSRYCLHSSDWDGTRYQSLNLTNLANNKGTFEVRVWESTLNPGVVVAAIYATVALVSMATDTTPLPNRMESPIAAIESLVRAMWSKPEYQMVPDDEAGDIQATMLLQASRAASSMAPHRRAA